MTVLDIAARANVAAQRYRAVVRSNRLTPEAKGCADALARATDELVTAICDNVATGAPALASAGSSPWERGESDSLDIDST